MLDEYAYGYCGMPCALCTRYRVNGKSRCEGCSHGGYYTDNCKVFTCARQACLAHCGQCPDYPCKRLGSMKDFRDLNTNGAKKQTCDSIARSGMDEWYKQYKERADMLTLALREYNNGRMKRWLCETFISLDLDCLRSIMSHARDIPKDCKDVGAAFKQIVNAATEEPNGERL